MRRERRGAGQALAPAKTAHFEPVGNIVGDIHPGKQAVLLEDHGVHRARVADLLRDIDRAARRAIEPGDDAQRRRLAAAARAHDADEFALADRQRKIVESDTFLTVCDEGLLQMGEDDLRARRWRFGVDRLCRDHRSATRPSVASAASSGIGIDRLFQIGCARENALFSIPGLLVQKALRRERPVRIDVAPLHAIVQAAILDQRMRDDRIDDRLALCRRRASHRP